MDTKAIIVAPSIHPCYEGHFPQHPVAPGVLLLELIAEQIGRGAPRGVVAVKFLQALAPGASCELSWQSNDGRVSFRCVSGTHPIAEGTFQYGAPA